jgi:hypothetical protein
VCFNQIFVRKGDKKHLGTRKKRFNLQPKPYQTKLTHIYMAHSEGHSSTERTILWIILPATIAVSLYFTKQSHGLESNRTVLNGNLGDMRKKEVVAPAKHEEGHGADTLHLDATHVEHTAKEMEKAKEQGQDHAPAKH